MGIRRLWRHIFHIVLIRLRSRENSFTERLFQVPPLFRLAPDYGRVNPDDVLDSLFVWLVRMPRVYRVHGVLQFLVEMVAGVRHCQEVVRRVVRGDLLVEQLSEFLVDFAFI